MIGCRIDVHLLKVFKKWGGRERLEQTLRHWEATQKGKQAAAKAAPA